MPQEPLSWDRSREKKHDRSSDNIRSVARWRDSHHPGPRWDDFRRPPPQGHGKQGGYQLFPDDSYGCLSFRPTDRMVADDNSYRPFSAAAAAAAARGTGYGKYARNTRNFFSPRGGGGAGSPWGDPADAFPLPKQQHDLSGQRSVSDLLSYQSHPSSDIDTSSWDHVSFKDQSDKLTAHRADKQQPLGPIAWKPLKWNRSTSLSSRGSGFSHTSSSRSIGAESDENKPDLPSGRATPVHSPSADGITPNPHFEDTCPRKKQRLGWGQGLAKYEKQKVEGSDETLTKTTLIPCATIARPSNSIPNMPDKSPRVTGPSECASPATTSSVACSSSPGIDDRPHMTAAINDIDPCNIRGDHEFQSCLEEFSANLEFLTSAINLSGLLSNVLQIEDASSGDSNFSKSTAMNKLLLVKSELAKALVKTEYEIDLFENELKILNSEDKSCARNLVASDSLEVECTSRSCENMGTATKVIQKPGPLQLISSSDVHTDIPNRCNVVLEEVHDDIKDDDIDSPGTATSKFVEPSCMEKAVPAYGIGNRDACSTDVVEAGRASSEKLWLMPSIYKEKAAIMASGDRVEQGDSISTHAPNDLNLECSLGDSILISNKNSVRQAVEELSNMWPTLQPESDMWGSCNISCQKNMSLVRKKLAARKCFKRFKERVLTLKFRALHHLWKEDLRLLSIRKYKAKSQKRIESNSRTPQIVYQKHRSSIRSRFTSPAGSLTLVPTCEIVDFTSKLLSDSQIKLCRDSLKMPSLVDEKEKSMLRFVSNNSLVEDPCAAEKERVMINPWTPTEKEVFLEKFATFGKNFKKIASYLDHKTTADCVEFYYKNHKSESFEKIMKKSELKKQEKGFTTNTYLMTSGKKWNCEVNAASLVLLGEASVIAADADETLKSQNAYLNRPFLGGQYYDKTCWGDDASHEKSSSVDILGNEREATAADALAGICGALSSEAMSSCVTSSIDPVESYQEGKFQKSSVMDRPVTPKFMQSIDDEETCSDESCEEMDSVDWTDEEKFNFIGALRSYGKDFMRIARCVRSRSKDQCKVFFSKARKSLGLDGVHLGTGREGTPMSDANGGRSDAEDACVYEMESAICSTQSCSKLDSDNRISVNCETYDHAATNHFLSCELDKVERDNGIGQLNQMQSDELEISGENSGTQPMNDDSVTVGEALTRANSELDCKSELNICGEDSSVLKEAGEVLDGSSETMHLEPDSASNCDALMKLNVDIGLSHSTEGVKHLQTTINDRSPSADGSRRGDNHLMTSDAIENKNIPAASAQSFSTETAPMQTVVPEDGDEHNPDRMTVLDDNTRSGSCCVDLDMTNINRKSLYQAPNASFQQGVSLTRNHLPQVPLELVPSVQSAPSISWKHPDDTSVPGPLIQHENHNRQGPPLSTLNFEGKRSEHQEPEYPDVNQQYLLRHHHSLNQTESSQILRGYPLQVLSKKEANGHMDPRISEKQCGINNSTVNTNFQPAQFIMPDFHLECNGSKLPQSLAELPFLPKSLEQTSTNHTRSRSQGSSDAEDTRRVGDVKLFGKILSHPSTSQRPHLVFQDTANKVLSLPKSSSTTLDLKFAHHGTDPALMRANRDDNKYLGCDDFPTRSYGFWDGSRIQTGFSALPDSSSLVAKYPAGFGDHLAGSSSGQQQSFPAMIKRDDRHSSPLSVYSVQNSSSNMILPEYQIYRSYDGVKLQPFAVDMKRQDAFMDMQKRNGLEVCSFQQSRGGVVGMNVMGAGLQSGGGGGVSDPVAAIKMHYATTDRDRYATQSGSTREEDSWRGDLGR